MEQEGWSEPIELDSLDGSPIVDVVLDSRFTRQQEALDNLHFMEALNEDDVICEVAPTTSQGVPHDDDLEFIFEETVIPNDSPCARQPIIINSCHPFLEITSDDELNSSCIYTHESKFDVSRKETSNWKTNYSKTQALPENEGLKQVDDLNITVEILLSKLMCPICYRNFRRKKFMTQYSKFLLKKQAEKKQFATSPSLNKEPVFDIPITSTYKSQNDLTCLHEACQDAKSQVSTCFSFNATHVKPLELSDNIDQASLYAAPTSISCTKEDPLKEEYETSELRVGRCGHVYCQGCIKKYVTLKKKCPVCNQSLTLRQLFPLYL
ncbi:uncharacterized protein LOC128883963 [Hylaeus volcanicus]|uniref:uncharacterized protein LOC128883963 n=1 Tax=Hylaeus volcanicus TaxID=313075 RepID=UPI0023B7AE71|nr:uncharacterized protein LOC128883963 [Hylaeus volcanicus]